MSESPERYQPSGDPVGPYQPARDTTIDAPVLLYRIAEAAGDPLIAARLRVLRGRRHDGALTLLDAVVEGSDLVIVYDAPSALTPLSPPLHYREVLNRVATPIEAVAAWHRDGLAVGALSPASLLSDSHGEWHLVPPVRDTADDDLREVGILLHQLLSNRPPEQGETLNGNVAALSDGRPVPHNLERLIADLLTPESPSRPPGLGELGHRLRAAAGMSKSTGTVPTVEISRDFTREINREFPERPQQSSGSGLNWGWLFLAIVCGLFAALIIFLRPPAQDPPPEEPPAKEVRQDAAVTPEAPTSEEPQAPEPEPGPEEPEEPAPPVEEPDKPDPAEQAAMQAAFEAMLAARAEAEAVGAPKWAPQRWQQLLEFIRLGDSAKADDQPKAAALAWNQAAQLAKAIYESRDAALPGLIEAGNRAVAAGDQDAAITNFQTALAIDPANVEAGTGLKRARVVNQVLAALARGAELEAKGALAAARVAYTEALKLDKQAPGALEAVKRLDAAIADEAFNKLLALARAKLVENDFEKAEAAVTKALDLQPNHPDGVKLAAAIALQKRRVQARQKLATATTAEAGEEWQSAYNEYLAAAQLDPTLTDAVKGAERVKKQHELATRIANYLTKPDLLLVPETRRNATLLVESAHGTTAAKSPKLAAAADKLALVLQELSAPISVQLSSDGNTQVTILKYRKLGTFDNLTVQLPPGKYIATGFRDGYQDVRVPFTIAPGSQPPAIQVVCTVTF